MFTESERSGRRTEHKAATRLALRDAAARCFELKGFPATGIADITREAGVAQGTFYVHFESKEALADELLAEFNDGLAELLGPIVAASSQASLPALVRSIGDAFLAYWEARRGFVAWYAERSALGLTLQNLRDGVNPPMVAFLQTGLAAVGARFGVERDFGLVSQGLLSMWLRLGLQALFNPAVSRAEALDTLVDLTVGAVSGVIPGAAGALEPGVK